MGIYGLLGEKLGHSYSPQIHSMLGEYTYDLFEVSKDDLDAFMKAAPFDGINVTIPYKKAVIPYCAKLSPAAEKIGSVNTIVKQPDGTLLGDNTDYFGFADMIKSSGIEIAGKKAIMLGNGGAAATVKTVLEDMNAKEIVIFDLDGAHTYGELPQHYDAEIIVNSTPVGMYPHNGSSLVDLREFKNCSGVLDVVYNPARTKLLLQAEELNIPHAGGLRMLVAQAKRASELFRDVEIEDRLIDRIHHKIAAEMQNIAIIGMPGCGKTTLGKELEKRTGRKLIDMDQMITDRIGCSIPEFFAAHGEAEFRKAETEVLSEISKESGLIISTGGGVVTKPENYPLLHQNSIIFFLSRDINSLAKKGRPISQTKTPQQLAEERMAFYEGWSDHKIEAVTPQINADKVMEILEK